MKRERIPGGPKELSEATRQSRITARRESETTQRIELSSNLKEMLRANEAEKTASLIILVGDDVGRVITVGDEVGDKVVIGRHPDCEAVMRDEGLSRRHAEVTQVGSGKIRIRDLGSTNGVYYKGNRVKEAIVADGEKIFLGQRMILRYAYQDTIDESYVNEMYETATRDALTNAFNRKHFFQRLKTDISFARRHHIPLTLLMLDIDFFKKVNDTHGHQTGDQVLVYVTRCIFDAIRNEDLLARYGGEEFAILAPGTDFEGARVLGERIRAIVATVEVPVVGGNPGEALSVTVSLGGATIAPSGVSSSDAIVAAADECLYKAKESGRNKVICGELE